jgi:hypothetical protein
MSTWDGTRWVADKAAPSAPRPSRAANWAATAVMVIGLAAVIAPLQLLAASSHNTGNGASCTLSSMVLGGSAVVEIDAVGMRHSTNYLIEWVEPALTQTEYMWSTSKGQLQDTVMNNQGAGTFSASLYWRSNQGDVWEASCSMAV